MLKGAAGDLAACENLKTILVVNHEDGRVDQFKLIMRRGVFKLRVVSPGTHEPLDSWPSVPFWEPRGFRSGDIFHWN